MLERATTSLAELEARIERGLDAWIEAALAWEEIRSERRYVDAGYSDFDTYTRERWGKRRETIDRMIRSAQVVTELNPIGLTPLPSNEAQARELARLPEKQRAEVWREAVERDGDKVTAATIRRIRTEDTPSYDVAEAAYRVADDAGKANLDRLNYLAALSRTLSQATGLLAYEPEHVAEVIDPEFKRLQIDVVAERIANWAQRVDAAMPTELRVVKGGRA